MTTQFTGPASFPLKQHINNKETTAVMGMPFKPETMTQGSDFAAARYAYIKDAGTNLLSTATTNRSYGNSKKKFNSSASEHINLKKMNAIGKSSTNHLKPTGGLMSFASADQTTVKSSLAKCRSSGCVAPKKKGGVL